MKLQFLVTRCIFRDLLFLCVLFVGSLGRGQLAIAQMPAQETQSEEGQVSSSNASGATVDNDSKSQDQSETVGSQDKVVADGKRDSEVEVVRDDRKTRIYACEIRFPLDSVQFNEKNIEECFQDIDRDRISYIHVVATASPEGTITHNLYLSTRRAGAIEGYIKNHFPEIEVHAFGGGINPKFGKAAQIFVVESAPVPEQGEPVKQVVTLQQAPLVPKAPEVQIVTKTEYIQPKKLGLEVRVASGLSSFRPQSGDYQFVGAGVFAPLRSYHLGLEYGMHRSNQVYDVHSVKLNVERLYRLWRIKGNATLEAGPLLYSGLSIIDKDRQLDYGGGGLLQLKSGDYTGNVTVGLSKHFRWLGIGVGALL